MRATCIVAGGRLLSGGVAPITNQDLNTESISLLVEYNNFDYLVSGDLTGGGSTSTAKTPDIETYVGQIVGDVDVVAAESPRQHDDEQSGVPVGGESRSRGRAIGREQHVRTSQPRDRQQVPQHAGHRRKRASPARACRRPSAPVRSSTRTKRARPATTASRSRGTRPPRRATPGRARSCSRPTAPRTIR